MYNKSTFIDANKNKTYKIKQVNAHASRARQRGTIKRPMGSINWVTFARNVNSCQSLLPPLLLDIVVKTKFTR